MSAMISVLVVDDESAIRQILVRWLAGEGYDVREAVDAETALEKMKRVPADVVFCDVEMPGHDGLWLAAPLRDHFPHTAIVLATVIDSIPPSTSLKPGIIEYLVKPFAQASVANAVRRASDWHLAALAAPPKPDYGAEGIANWLEDAAIDDLVKAP